MSKKLFTKEEIEILSNNIFVKKISAKGITYSDEFKRLFIAENEKGKLPRQIFEECGFDIDIIGINRIKSSANRWRTTYQKSGVSQLQDTRKFNTGRPSERNLSIEEKYIIINSIIEKYKLKNMVNYLCELSNVSRSRYYNYFSPKSHTNRVSCEDHDLESYNNILMAFNFKNRRKGAKQIKMTLENEFNIIYNLKRIRRIMKKYNIFCPHRKANPYIRMMKSTKEHSVLPNLLNREFKQETPGKVLLTDITYLFYNNGQKAYLSTILDASTNEILSYNLSKSLKIEIVTDTIEKLMVSTNNLLSSDTFIHSDQGVHYTSPIF